MDLKGSKTEKNLATAFAGESQARNKYTYFASKAKKDGYEQIAEIFTETANNEKEHAKLWYKLLAGGIGAVSSVEDLVQVVSVADGGVGDGDGAGVLSGKSGNAQRKNQGQHHKDG